MMRTVWRLRKHPHSLALTIGDVPRREGLAELQQYKADGEVVLSGLQGQFRCFVTRTYTVTLLCLCLKSLCNEVTGRGQEHKSLRLPSQLQLLYHVLGPPTVAKNL